MDLIEIVNVTKKFDNFTAVNNVNLKIKKGEFLGLLGPNGAGKTTIIKMLTGLLKPTEGEIYIDGRKMSRNNVEIQQFIVSIHNLDKTSMKTWSLQQTFGSTKTVQHKIKELLEFMELEEYKNRQVFKLSGGMQG